MKVTQEYLDNVKELEKFIKTFNFEEKSLAKVRQYIENPLSVVNDDIKALFAKYDNEVVDYRIPLPSSMMKQRRKLQREIFLIYSLMFDCLSAEDQFKFSIDESGNIKPDFSISPFSIADGFFNVGSDKRKIWRYLDSKAASVAERVYKKWLANKTFSVTADGYYKEHVDIKSSRLGFSEFFLVMDEYVSSLGTRKTSLRDKISKFSKSNSTIIDITGKSEEEAIKILTTEAVKPIFNITQEIISAKTIDLDKYKLYLSFNVFDWLLASSGETWHSCIDMASSYAYGVGILGMCGCPDWGMLLYTDGSKKQFGGINTYHIVTRSWVCYLESGKFQLIGWYPKDIRGNVIFTNSEDFKFFTGKDNGDRYSGESSKSSWEPILFSNGALAWIYSDMYKFVIDKNRENIRFSFDGSTGLPRVAKADDGQLYPDRDGAVESVILSVKRNHSSIWDAVNKGYVIDRNLVYLKTKRYTCACCGDGYSNERDVIWIDSEAGYVCRSCLQREFYECPNCGTYHRYDDAYELRTGDNNPWDYDLICSDCFESLLSDEEIFLDEVTNEYFHSDVMRVFYDRDNNQHRISSFTSDRMIRNGELFPRNGELYNYEEGDN